MEARVGDRLVGNSHHVGNPAREAVVLEVHGPNGAAPYTVKWNDGHERVFFPSSDCSVEHPQS